MKRYVIILIILISSPIFANGTISAHRWGRPFPLNLIKRDVTVNSKNGIAYMQIEDTFQNDNELELEGIYKFKLPVGAFVSGFWINTDEKAWTKGTVKEITQARKIYKEITNRMIDPGLLESHDNQIVIKVFPIQAKKTVGIRFRCFFPESGDKNDFIFKFPIGFGNTKSTPNFLRRRRRVQTPQVHFKFAAAFYETVGFKNFNCTMKDANVNQDKNKCKLSININSESLSDFEVSYQIEKFQQALTNQYLLPTGKQFSLVRLSNLNEVKTEKIQKVAIIVDTSGSMGETNKQKANKFCSSITQEPKIDTSIFQLNTSGLSTSSLEQLAQTKSRGKIQWKSLYKFKNKNYDAVILLTDGEHLKNIYLKKLWEKINKKTIVLVIVGSNPIGKFLNMNYRYGICSFIAKGASNKEVNEISQEAIKVVKHNPKLQFNKQSFSPLFGSIANRAYYVVPYKSGKYNVADADGITYLNFEITKDSSPQKVSPWFVSLAAKQRIQKLEAQEQTKKTISRIINMGVKYSIATDYTAFIAVPDDIAKQNADIMNPAYLLMFATPTFRKARQQARGKACHANQRVLLGATEMYNMDNVKMMGLGPNTVKFDIKKLVELKYLRKAPQKPDAQCEYRVLGNLSGTGFIYCVYHGAVSYPGLSTEEMLTKYCKENKLNPDDFIVPFELFKSPSPERKLRKLISQNKGLIGLFLLML